MSLATLPPIGEGTPDAVAEAHAEPRRATSLSPNQRAWARFKRNRLGYISLFVFVAMLIVGTFAEVFSNERPLVARYQGEWFFPILGNQPETRFGGDFATPTDWHDPFIQQQFAKQGNFALFTFNEFGDSTLDYYARAADPVAAGQGTLVRAPTRPAATSPPGCCTGSGSASSSAWRSPSSRRSSAC